MNQLNYLDVLLSNMKRVIAMLFSIPVMMFANPHRGLSTFPQSNQSVDILYSPLKKLGPFIGHE